MSTPAPAAPVFVTSRDNALVKDLRRLSQDSTAYRKQGRVWLEGDHLCRAALLRGLTPAIAVFSESFWPLAPAEWTRPSPILAGRSNTPEALKTGRGLKELVLERKLMTRAQLDEALDPARMV